MNQFENTAVKLSDALEDTVITAKAKAVLITTSYLESLHISVETNDGNLVLSGSVVDVTSIKMAVSAVSNIDGVKSVINRLAIKA